MNYETAKPMWEALLWQKVFLHSAHLRHEQFQIFTSFQRY